MGSEVGKIQVPLRDPASKKQCVRYLSNDTGDTPLTFICICMCICTHTHTYVNTNTERERERGRGEEEGVEGSGGEGEGTPQELVRTACGRQLSSK